MSWCVYTYSPHVPPTLTPSHTYDIQLVCGVDVSGRAGHLAGVPAAVPWLQVLQGEGPLGAGIPARGGQGCLLLPPGDGGRGGPCRLALQTHRAPHGLVEDTSTHFGRLAESGLD